MIGLDPGGLSNHRGLYIYLEKADAVYKKGDLVSGTASLDLQDSLEIIGQCFYDTVVALAHIYFGFRSILARISLIPKPHLIH